LEISWKKDILTHPRPDTTFVKGEMRANLENLWNLFSMTMTDWMIWDDFYAFSADRMCNTEVLKPLVVEETERHNLSK